MLEKSPLRYPGGKSRAVETLYKFLPKNTKKLCSPFLGGGSLEIYCAQNGIGVYGYDIFHPLVDFWQYLLSDPQKLADNVAKYYPLSRSDFYKLQKMQFDPNDKLERATIFFVLNRTSFSGSTLSGGMATGGENDNPRFTPSSIDRLRRFKVKNMSVDLADFKESIPRHRDIMLYLDPPYLIESKLYGRNGDLHKNFDHEALARILKKREKWMLSYNDSDTIRAMYEGFQFVLPRWTYGMSKIKKSNEILIVSNDISIDCKENILT